MWIIVVSVFICWERFIFDEICNEIFYCKNICNWVDIRLEINFVVSSVFFWWRGGFWIVCFRVNVVCYLLFLEMFLNCVDVSMVYVKYWVLWSRV